jgi:hypothetical protein
MRHALADAHRRCYPQERMRRLEALRLELDSRRRTVTELQGEPNESACLSTLFCAPQL